MLTGRAVFHKEICAPAKVNVHLAVGARRADGFHDIESIFVPVTLCDRIDLSVTRPEARSEAFSVTIRGMEGGQDGVPWGISLEQNLMYRAARLFHQTTGFAFSLRIAIEKNIPQGAGLGGGSSNAAAILGALNEAAGFPLSQDALMETAARLGSDIPFFLTKGLAEGKAAFVTGRGEKVAPFDLARDLFFVLVKPAFASDTAEAYRLLDERRSVSCKPLPEDSTLHGSFPREPIPPETLVAALEKPPSEWPYRNDFQNVFLDDRYPHSGAYRALFSSLQESGAAWMLLSGSGSTVFGVYESADAAERAAVVVAEGLSRGHCKTRQPEMGRPLVRPFVRSCAAIRCS